MILSRNIVSLVSRRYQCNLGYGAIVGKVHCIGGGNENLCCPLSILNQQKRNLTQPTSSVWFTVDTPPVSYAYNLLTSVHDSFGMPWWASIVLSTVILRTCTTLPIFVLSAKNSAKLELLTPEVKKLAEDLSLEIAYAKMQNKWSERVAQVHFRKNMKRHILKLYERENCHPAKNLILPWIQIPIWLSMSFSLRNMTGMDTGEVLHPELATEGILWFQDLLLPDIGLPLIFCTANILLMEMHNLRSKNPTRNRKIITNIMRIINVLLFPIAAYCPSSLTLFWACSSSYGLLQNIALSFPRVKRIIGIPKSQSEVAKPFQDLCTLTKEKFSFRK